MKVGEIAELEVSPEDAYGRDGFGSYPCLTCIYFCQAIVFLQQ